MFIETIRFYYCQQQFDLYSY